MVNGGRDRRSKGILDHDFIVALVREQIRQVLPEAMKEVTGKRKPSPSLSPKADTERLRVSVNEAARIIGVSRARLYQHVREGTIRHVKDGKRTLFTMTELQQFVASTDSNHDAVQIQPPLRKKSQT